ncbi:MAG: ATP-dependent DNA helicase PcrA [Chloroflexi bacterium]|nr:ATP-dependent DNA helicase PcrA [Chloroflexota bacterium]
MELLEKLNPQQKQAVTTDPGPVLVLAGPGSGKTRVLTQRVAYVIDRFDVHPYHLMAVTFTNKAAREMGERVAKLLGRQTRGLTLGTFHATCARILRVEAEHLPVDSNYVIFDADDQVKVVKQVIKDHNLDDKRYRPRSVHASISAAKNELYLPEDFPIDTYRAEVVARIYEDYQKTLLTSNAMDFDDLLLWMAILLEDYPSIREKYARRFEHILVDEFQDTNIAQYTLLKHLASYHRNIFVVGDADQSIYRWRGADYRNVMRFKKDFSEAEVILLEQNYRSTQTILDVAMAVIDQNTHRTPKRLFTEREAGPKVHVKELFDEREQAQYVVDTIARQVASKKAKPGDFAVMYRINAQSRLLEEAFLSANLPYKLVGAQRFYGRREVKDIIAYLRLIFNPHDEISLSRVIGTPPRGIGTKTYAQLRTHAQKLNISSGDLLADLAKGKESEHLSQFSTRAAKALSRFGRLLVKWLEDKDTLPPVEIMDQILEDVGYQDYLDDGSEEGRERWENVMELRRLASEYQTVGLQQFLEDVALVSDQDTLEEGADAPTLLTLHAAKGLEFSQVFIVGLNDGVLPHQRSFEDPEGMEEERRLFYVGITRAKDRVYLSHALNRYVYGHTEPGQPSRYYADIPADLRDDGRLARQQRRKSQVFRPWKKASPPPAKKVEAQYKAGMKIQHPKWDKGLVIGSKIQDDDEILDIVFDTVGLKKVIASLANLEVIE